MFICRIMMVALIGLWLGGCSVVVFEDSTACAAEIACAASIADPTLSIGESNPTELGNSISKKSYTPTASTDIGETEDSLTALVVPVEIDGFLSYFDYDSAALRKPAIAGLLFVADYLKANPMTQKWVLIGAASKHDLLERNVQWCSERRQNLGQRTAAPLFDLHLNRASLSHLIATVRDLP